MELIVVRTGDGDLYYRTRNADRLKATEAAYKAAVGVLIGDHNEEDLAKCRQLFTDARWRDLYAHLLAMGAIREREFQRA